MVQCYHCYEEITFDDEHIGRNGNKIPLDADTEQIHRCRVWIAQHIKYRQCRGGCGNQIYFDEKHKTSNGKWIPVDKETKSPHQCPNSDYNA